MTLHAILLSVPGEYALPRIALPDNADDFLSQSVAFHVHLNRIKSLVPVRDFGWYPYNSLAALPEFVELLRDDYSEVVNVLRSEAALELGGADGDFAVLLDHFGVTTDAVDCSETNYNRMHGLRTLTQALGAEIQIADLDLDGRFSLPREEYGLVIFLGTLYHLKNPFYILEELAKRAAYCILSTRIAQVTYGTGLPIAAEPLAYFLNARETNDDQTNYWIFSRTALFRLFERTGWFPRAHFLRGCMENADPVAPDADQRIFLLLKSRRRYANVHARPLQGWHPAEEDSWRWTAKRFAIEVVLPHGGVTREFALKFLVADAIIQASGEIKIGCHIAGQSAGSMTFDQAGITEFRGILPPCASDDPVVTLEFTVENSYQSDKDPRELGVLVPLLSSAHSATTRLPFWVS